MSFLNLRKKKDEVKPVPAPVNAPQKLRVVGESVTGPSGTVRHDVLVRPHITEKAEAGKARGVYVFEVSESATKREIDEAVRALYRVSPRKVAIGHIRAKRITVKGRPGVTRGGKKAYVYLKEGEKIEIN